MSQCCNINDRNLIATENIENNFSTLWRLILAAVLAGQLMVFGLGINLTPPDHGSESYIIVHSLLVLLTIIVLSLLGKSLFKEALKNLKQARLTLETLFTLTALGALAGSLISTFTGKGQVYYEVVAIVLVIYTIGKLLTQRSRQKAIQESHKLKHDFNYAYILDNEGKKKRISIEDLHCCSEIIVGPGDAVTVDGIITQGEGYIKETAMTGELEPTPRRVGDFILAGTYSIDGIFTIKPTATKGQRRLDGLLKIVQEAHLTPSQLHSQANKIVRYFLPIIIIVSLFTFLFWITRVTWTDALFNSMAVLLVACPCALGLATPIAIWSGLWKLSTLGLISKSGELIEGLAQADWIVFDKTGTLSEEELELTHFQILPSMQSKETWLKNAIHAIETPINHPIAHALLKIKKNSDHSFDKVTSKIIPGKGIQAQLKEQEKLSTLHIGELTLMPNPNSPLWQSSPDSPIAKKRIYISLNNEPAAILYLNEKLRSNLKSIFQELKTLGLKSIILTGDGEIKYNNIESIELIPGLTPTDKESKIKELEEKNQRTIFIGDGVNDTPAMTASSTSIAMGNAAALTQSTATAILMGQSLETLPKAIKLCRKIKKTAKGNMLYAAIYNTLGMTLAATGILHPVVAALLMLSSSIFISIRATKAINL